MKILVVAHPYDPQAYFIAKAFRDSFISLGHPSSIQEKYQSGYDVCLLFYAHIRHDLPQDSTYKIAYNWECTLNPRWYKKIHRALKQYNCIWECNEENLKAKLPIKCVACPIGYHSSFELEGISDKMKHQVAFLGKTYASPRRKKIIEEIENVNHIKVWSVHTKSDAVHAWSKVNSIGEISHNTLVHLNVHQNLLYPMFESIRVISMLLCNKSFVISEPSLGSPLVHGEHYVEAEDLPSTVKYYLEHPDECKTIAEQGYNFIKSSYTLEQHIASCLRISF